MMMGEGHVVAEEWAKNLVAALVSDAGIEGGGMTFTSRSAMEEAAEDWINDHTFLFVDVDGAPILN